MSSSWTERRRDAAYEKIAESRPEVMRSGRVVAAEPIAEGSFFVRPHDLPVIVSLDDGVPSALRSHLSDQGLTRLAASVGDLEKLGERLGKRPPEDRSISDTVYQMY